MVWKAVLPKIHPQPMPAFASSAEPPWQQWTEDTASCEAVQPTGGTVGRLTSPNRGHVKCTPTHGGNHAGGGGHARTPSRESHLMQCSQQASHVLYEKGHVLLMKLLPWERKAASSPAPSTPLQAGSGLAAAHWPHGGHGQCQITLHCIRWECPICHVSLLFWVIL